MKEKDLTKLKSSPYVFIVLTMLLTWCIQFIPILLKMNVENTSVSSFDVSSVFFTMGGMMPSLLGVIFVLITYSNKEKRNFFKRCFIPKKRGWLCIVGALVLICVEIAVAQRIARTFFDAEAFGFVGLKVIVAQPYMIFYYLFWGIISGPFSEEFGWRGYLQERLLQKYSMLKTTLIIGVVWGIWHLPLFFYPAQIQYDWIHTSIWLGVGFMINCVSDSLLYNIFYVLSKGSVFVIFFVHMFENIVKTGIMIYPFSNIYSYIIIPVSIVIDILFYIVMSRTKWYQKCLQKIKEKLSIQGSN